MNVRAFAVISAVLAAGSLYAQKWFPVGTVYFSAKDYSPWPVVDAPYCAEKRNVRTLTQPDGTKKTEEYAPSKTCRDSAGRSRLEYPVWLQPGGPPVGPLEILIRDPVAHARYVVYAVNKTVYRQEMPETRTVHPPVRGGSGGGNVEDLGTQTMEGLPVEGRRFVKDIPAGSEGNDTSFIRTFEEWWSPELGVYVLQKSSDLVKGELVHQMVHISRGEPDAEMFRPPADYAVVDETGDFTILWGSESGAIPVDTAGH